MTPGCYRAQWEPNGFCGQHAGKNPYLWNPRMIREIVKRREYLGETVNFKTCCPDLHARQIDNPPDKWLCFPGTHEAIVTPEVWHAAQRIYHPNMSSTPGMPCKLTGMIICGECGAPMLFSRNNRNEQYNNYACRTNQQSVGYAERLCSRNGIQVAVIRQIVRDTLRTVNRYAIADEEDFRRRLAREAATYQPDDRKKLTKQIREKEKHIARLEHLLKKLYEDYALGHIPEERFDRLSAQYEQEEAALKVELISDQARLNEVQTAAAQTDKYLALARKYRDCTEISFIPTASHPNPPLFYQQVRSVDEAIIMSYAVSFDSIMCHAVGLCDDSFNFDDKKELSKEKVAFISSDYFKTNAHKWFDNNPIVLAEIKKIRQNINSSTPYISLLSPFIPLFRNHERAEKKQICMLGFGNAL